MKKIRKILENIKTQPDIWLFFLFLFTFSLSIRKVILYFPIQGTFNEYFGIYVYISDIFLVLTIILWLFIILCNIKDYPSISSLWITCREHNLSTVSRHFLKSHYLLIPLALVVWSFLSISWSDNISIALFRSIKLLEFYLLYLYIILRLVPRGTRKDIHCSMWNIFSTIIILSATVQSLISIIQISLQKSVGLRFLQESIISTAIPGVAKIVFHGERYIRAYGLFPHPNVLGGYLLLSIIITLLCLKLFHVEQFKFLWGGTIFTKLLYSSLIIQSIALILSFSKSAILGLAIALLYIYVPRLPRGMFHACLPAGRWNNSRMRIAILSILIVISLGLIANQDLDRNLEQSFQERLIYLNVSRGTILANPVMGTGIGQFVWNIPKYALTPVEAWQFQPVHNVFLLIWSELGILGLWLFICWLYSLFTAKPILNNDNTFLSIDIPLRYFKGILLGFIFIMLFDHYFWDIQQGSLMLWMTLGFIAGIKRNKKNLIEVPSLPSS